MIQVVYMQYGEVKVKSFSGTDDVSESLNFIDVLQNHLFLPGGVVLAVYADEWAKVDMGKRSVKTLRVWTMKDRMRYDNRLDEWIEHEGVAPCIHCDQWCRGKCRASQSCLKAGKPGHTHCKSQLIESGVLTPGRW